VAGEDILHVVPLTGPNGLSRDNQANLKDKSSARQSLPVVLSVSCEAATGRSPNVAEVPNQSPPSETKGRNPMPLIQVRVIKDVFSKEQKGQIISKLTDAMVSIEGENMRGVTWCVVEEVESGDWGIGGTALTTADVHALARGKAN
jgi:4-oxalocrotonate tautomerase